MPLFMLILWILGGASLLFLGGFTLVSMREGEKRAAAITAILTTIITGFFILAGFLPAPFQPFILFCMAGIFILGVILFSLPAEPVKRLRDVSSKRFD